MTRKKRAFLPPSRRPSTDAELGEIQLRISQRKFESAMQSVARLLGEHFRRDMIPLPPAPKPDPTYPTALRILYRKLPCGYFGDYEGPCVTFDVIPLGVRGDPRRLRSYRSFAGTVEDSEELFADLLKHLYRIVEAVRKHHRMR